MGFNLIQLLIAVAIVGLLATVVGLNTSNARAIARDSVRVSDLTKIQTALNLYFADNRQYPATLVSLVSTYIPRVPTDPLGTGVYTYKYAARDTNGSGSSCESYHAGAVMENAGSVGLKQDSDMTSGTICTGSAPDFHGNATNCSGGSAASPDPCFDLAP